VPTPFAALPVAYSLPSQAEIIGSHVVEGISLLVEARCKILGNTEWLPYGCLAHVHLMRLIGVIDYRQRIYACLVNRSARLLGCSRSFWPGRMGLVALAREGTEMQYDKRKRRPGFIRPYATS
jgi:hypothetical protein